MWGFIRGVFKYWEPLELEGDISHVRNRKRREDRILKILDGIGFSGRVYAVAFLGFLASSWSLIATNITMPALFYVYAESLNKNNHADTVLDTVTLTGTVIGMILFGHLADRMGRSALYGFELLVVLCAIGGAAFSSQGYVEPLYSPSMNIYASLIWWRFILGLGIGAEYPMSAVIAAEFAATASRGTMLAAIFLAQPVGRLLAYGLSLGILYGYANSTGGTMDNDNDNDQHAKAIVDKIWRLALGLAGVPAVFAIGLRLFIPETPRFYSAIKRDLRKAWEVVTRMGSSSPPTRADVESINSDLEGIAPPEKFEWGSNAWTYFFGKTQGWRRLFSISLQWLLLDIAFYGTGLDSPSTLAALSLSSKPNATDLPDYNDDPENPGADIYLTIRNNSVRTLEISSLAGLVGSILIIPLLNYVSRKTLYVSTSLALAVLFGCAAIAVDQTFADYDHYASIVFYSLTQFMFNLGPNTLTFIIAAEIFPTEFRGTCYGIAAAAGKVGALIIRPVLGSVSKDQHTLVIMLSLFAVILFAMAVLAWFGPLGFGIPQIQEPRPPKSGVQRLKNISLEAISPWPPSSEKDNNNMELGHRDTIVEVPLPSTGPTLLGVPRPINSDYDTRDAIGDFEELPPAALP